MNSLYLNCRTNCVHILFNIINIILLNIEMRIKNNKEEQIITRYELILINATNYSASKKIYVNKV